MEAPGVVAHAFELVAIADVAREPRGIFSAGEQAYARAKSDPERRLAARLAAKRAARRLLGEDLDLAEIEVLRTPGGPPFLRLSTRAAGRLQGLGAARLLVSLTHSRGQAAAVVLAVAA